MDDGALICEKLFGYILARKVIHLRYNRYPTHCEQLLFDC